MINQEFHGTYINVIYISLLNKAEQFLCCEFDIPKYKVTLQTSVDSLLCVLILKQ